MHKLFKKLFDNTLLLVVYILLTVLAYYIVIFIWEGYNERRVYSLSSCSETCSEMGYTDSACLWISERSQGMKNVGNCKVKRSSHCSQDGQCHCMCSNNNSLLKYAKGIDPVIIESKNLNVFYIHAKATTTTGYNWHVDYDPNYLELSERIRKDDYIIGEEGGSVTFKFNTINSGKTKIYLYYRQPWEPESAPLKVQVYEIYINQFFRINVTSHAQNYTH